MRARGLLLIALGGLALVCAALIAVRLSGAYFTTSSTTLVMATTDSIGNWAHLYSQASDPEQAGGYFTPDGTATPAASGRDGEIRLDLGSMVATDTRSTATGLFAVQAVPGFPTPVATVTVSVTAAPDPSTHVQPLSQVAMAPFGDPSTDSSEIVLAPGEKAQVNATLDLTGATPGVEYHPAILVTLTYEGMRATYYQYRIPVSVTATGAPQS